MAASLLKGPVTVVLAGLAIFVCAFSLGALSNGRQAGTQHGAGREDVTQAAVLNNLKIEASTNCLEPKKHHIVSEFIRSIGYKPPGADDPSPFFIQDKHPSYDVVIDVGAYNCKDYTITGFKKGYTVYSFELNPRNVDLCLATFNAENLRNGLDYTVIDVTPGEIPRVNADHSKPHIYFFKAGVSNRVGRVDVRGGDVMTQVGTMSSGNVPLVRIDDIIPADSRVYVFKSDTQGHENGVFTGAADLLKRAKIHLLALEFWPQGARENEFNAKDLLDLLYQHGFQCFDAGVHLYDTVGRPAGLYEFTDFLDALPRSFDPIGAWEDLVCTRFDS